MQYKFKVTSRKTKAYFPEMEESISIQVSESEFNPTSFMFVLQLDRDNTEIKIKDITLKVGVAWQDMETVAYLKGKFTFDSERSINQALLELQKAFNQNDYSIDSFKESWRELHNQFVKWFIKDFKVYLDKLVESHKILISLNRKANNADN